MLVRLQKESLQAMRFELMKTTSNRSQTKCGLKSVAYIEVSRIQDLVESETSTLR